MSMGLKCWMFLFVWWIHPSSPVICAVWFLWLRTWFNCLNIYHMFSFKMYDKLDNMFYNHSIAYAFFSLAQQRYYNYNGILSLFC